MAPGGTRTLGGMSGTRTVAGTRTIGGTRTVAGSRTTAGSRNLGVKDSGIRNQATKETGVRIRTHFLAMVHTEITSSSEAQMDLMLVLLPTL